jgi:hypothetical protein
MKKLFYSKFIISIVCMIICITFLFGACGKSDVQTHSEDNGQLYTIDSAYESGWLTKDDLMDICYYAYKNVWTGEDKDSSTWVKVDYTPSRKLDSLDSKVETSIKECYYNLNKSKFIDKDGKSLGGIEKLTVKYYGTYNDCVAVSIDCSLWSSGAVATPKLLAGVAWWKGNEELLIYKSN